MIKMKVMGIAIDTKSGAPIVVLNDLENRKALPIWIGSAEAGSIIRKIENIKVLRPMTHDLIVDIVSKMGGKIDHIEINEIKDETYYAQIFIIDEKDNEILIDSRPSDAIAVAIRTQSDIYVSSPVLAQGAISCNSEKDEQEALEFKNFVENIKPSDFEKILKRNEDSDQ